MNELLDGYVGLLLLSLWITGIIWFMADMAAERRIKKLEKRLQKKESK